MTELLMEVIEEFRVPGLRGQGGISMMDPGTRGKQG